MTKEKNLLDKKLCIRCGVDISHYTIDNALCGDCNRKNYIIVMDWVKYLFFDEIDRK